MTIPVPAFTYLGCHLIMDNQRKCQLDYYCEKTRHYNLLYDPFYTLGSSRNYALCSQIYVPFSLHKNYNGSMCCIQRWSEYNTNVLEYDYFEHA